MTEDPYLKLKSNPFCSEESPNCVCDKPTYVMGMMVSYHQNPIRCLGCLEIVEPTKLPVPVDLVYEVADWSITHSALQWLAFQTTSYEAWADKELTDIRSNINKEGIRLQRELSKTTTIYYWHTRSLNTHDNSCPICNGSMKEIKYPLTRVVCCESCLLVAAPAGKNGKG